MIENDNSLFIFLPERKYVIFTDKNYKEYLLKWSMKDRINCQCFGFDETFKPYNINNFLKKFFDDPNVCAQLNKNCPLIPCEIETVPCTLTSLDLFNGMVGKIHRENGKLFGIPDEYYNGVLVSDELRKMLLMEDSDYYELFDEEIRKEFLFHLFKGFCVGGEICQYEDDIQPYLDICKAFYKDLISVHKEQGDKIVTISHVYRFRCKNKQEQIVFPDSKEHENTFAYVIIDPRKKHIHCLWHSFGCGSF